MNTAPATLAPWLLNANSGCPEWILARVGLGDYVKIAVFHPVVPEYLWLQVCLQSSHYWIGQVRSVPCLVDWIKPGDLIRFAPANIVDARKG